MKKILLTFLSIIPILLCAQIDSTEIFFKSVGSQDLEIICSLTDIQITKLISYDKKLKNKTFNLIIKEFKKGKVKTVDDFNLARKPEEITVNYDGDSLTHRLEMSEYAGFNDSRNKDSLIITFSGKLIKGDMNISITYPGLFLPRKFKGKSGSRLVQIQTTKDGMLKVPLNQEVPILTYAPPSSKISINKTSDLFLEREILKWFDENKIKHYYIVFLEIK